ncbi:hypothetical protein K449DRAFT_260918 [Hypoxylon sp. EC38]|nr:hypothetical protein K449DRAFT_260918 [Hypoxylon sp. EC38]
MRHSQFFRSATFFFFFFTTLHFYFFFGCNVSLAKGSASKHIPSSSHFTGVCCLILWRQVRREIDYFCIIHKNYRITSFVHAHVILENKNANKGGLVLRGGRYYITPWAVAAHQQNDDGLR